MVYNNSTSAYVYGVEVEFRKSLASLGVSKFLRNTSVNINAAYMKSQVGYWVQMPVETSHATDHSKVSRLTS